MSTIDVKPGRNGYKILFDKNTVIMNHKFAAAASEYGTDENKLMKSIRVDFPGMREVVVSGHEKKTAAKNSRLTYENMEKYIGTYENAEQLLDAFRTVKAMSAAVASPYKFVSDWFKKQFPNYKEAPTFQDGKLLILPVDPPKVEDYKIKMAKGA